MPALSSGFATVQSFIAKTSSSLRSICSANLDYISWLSDIPAMVIVKGLLSPASGSADSQAARLAFLRGQCLRTASTQKFCV